MTTHSHQGFTIIEVMIFLAISALLATVTLVGWSVNINTQSYRDSARSLASTIQQQYTNSFNVANERGGNLGCKKNGTNVQINDSMSEPLGASDCVIMGRYLAIDGSDIKINTVLGFEPSTAADPTDTDIDTIRDYQPTKADDALLAPENYVIPWSSRPYYSTSDTDTVRLAMLIIRSPQTGDVYTYTKRVAEGDFPSAQSLLSTNPVLAGSRSAVQLCLEPTGAIAQGRMAVLLSANAASASAVSVLVDSEAAC